MKLISLNINGKQQEWIQIYVDLGYFQDRSACIRGFINYGIKYMADLIAKKPEVNLNIIFDDFNLTKKQNEECFNVINKGINEE